MKILYGVQGTGNGHLSRARAIAPQFKRHGIEVDYLFSGRKPEQYFDMEPFGNWQSRDGLTFISANGKINPIATARHNSLVKLWKDIRSLDVSQYDLVITDFEPVTAWAAHRQKIKTLGIGHQYAFRFNVPLTGDSPLSRTVMHYFAPSDIQLGLHWHHFNQPILPPICDLDDHPAGNIPNKIVVYLGFENPDVVIPLLQQFKQHEFFYYGEFKDKQVLENVHLHPLSRNGFKKDLSDCNGVICNAGFELTSEAIHLGKKVLVKPLAGQMEQLSNALALSQLGLGQSMKSLNAGTIDSWLATAKSPQCQYPDVAKAITDWVIKGDYSSPASLAKSLWDATSLATKESAA